MMFSSIGDFFPVMPKSGNLDDNKTKFRNIDFFEAMPLYMHISLRLNKVLIEGRNYFFRKGGIFGQNINRWDYQSH